MIVTLAERKARAIARLEAGFEPAAVALAAYAAARGGRFVIFGSFARGDIHPDSDCDVMVDFPAAAAREARDAAETILRVHGLTPDVLLESEVSEGLMRRITRDGRVLEPIPSASNRADGILPRETGEGDHPKDGGGGCRRLEIAERAGSPTTEI